MTLLVRPQHTVFQNPRRLPSATEGIEFVARFEVVWRPRHRREPNLADSMRADVVEIASQASVRRTAYDLTAAENFVNARLAAWGSTATSRYRHITPRVSLSLSEDVADMLTQRRADEERVRRLTFLKTRLYSDPALVVLEYLERNPGAPGDELINRYLHALNLIDSSRAWWAPLLEGGEALAQQLSAPDLAYILMRALNAAIRDLTQQAGKAASLTAFPSAKSAGLGGSDP